MILVLALACGGGKGTLAPDTAGETGGEDLDPATVPLAGWCEDDVHYGNFVADANEDYAWVGGGMLDGVVPVTILTEVAREGDCAIFRRENPYCNPSCDPGTTCDFTGECIPWPEGVDLGLVTVHGLLEPVEMEPVVPGNTYFDTSVPNPPWEPGEVVTLRTEGGDIDPFELHGVSPDPLTLTETAWVLASGEALALTWTPPVASSRAQVRVGVQIDQHGSTPATVVCWLEDDGAGEIPASIVDALLSMGLSGFPNGSAARLTTDKTDAGGGCVDLWLSSSVVPAVSVSGYTPCKTDDECPKGQQCNEEMQRCE